jgi:hypothetical protein
MPGTDDAAACGADVVRRMIAMSAAALTIPTPMVTVFRRPRVLHGIRGTSVAGATVVARDTPVSGAGDVLSSVGASAAALSSGATNWYP